MFSTLANFKEQIGVKSIQFMQGTGRQFANITVNGKPATLIIGSNTDTTKPLFVSEMTTDKNAVAIAPGTAFVVVNSEKIKTGVSL